MLSSCQSEFDIPLLSKDNENEHCSIDCHPNHLFQPQHFQETCILFILPTVYVEKNQQQSCRKHSPLQKTQSMQKTCRHAWNQIVGLRLGQLNANRANNAHVYSKEHGPFLLLQSRYSGRETSWWWLASSNQQRPTCTAQGPWQKHLTLETYGFESG